MLNSGTSTQDTHCTCHVVTHNGIPGIRNFWPNVQLVLVALGIALWLGLYAGVSGTEVAC